MNKLFLVFLLSILPSMAVSKPHPSIGKNHNIHYSKKDLKVGKYILQIERQLKSYSLVKSTAKNAHNLALKSPLFKDYSDVLFKIKKVAAAKLNDKDFHNSCTINIQESENSNINRLSSRTSRYCRFFFLRLNLKNKSKGSITTRNLNFLKDNLSFYLKGEHKKLFTRFIRNTVSNENLKLVVTSAITDALIKTNIKPDTKILKHLSIDSDLTIYVQNRGIKDKSASKYFTSEFYRQRNEIRKHIKKNEFDESFSKLHQLQTFFNQNKSYISHKKAWISFITIGKELLYKKQIDKSRLAIKYSLNIAKEDQIDESKFQLLWSYLLNDDFKGALAAIERMKLLENFNNHNSKVKYWIAFTLLKNDSVGYAKKLFRRITDSSPLNYYSILSIKKLKKLENIDSATSIIDKQYKKAPTRYTFTEKSFTKEFEQKLKRLNIWLDLENDSFSTRLIRDVLKTEHKDLFSDHKKLTELDSKDFQQKVIYTLIELFNSEKKFLHSFKLMHTSLDADLLSIDSLAIKYLFPFQYYKTIRSLDRSIDPIVVLSLIRQESAFNPKARSGVGARGLMQLMPRTARIFKRNLKTKHLARPKTNIRIGIKYLKRLLKKYDGNLIFALSAYNAGESRVKRWRRELFQSDDPLKTIESIPFKETRKYVKLIYRNIFFYKLLSNKELLNKSVNKSFTVSLNKN